MYACDNLLHYTTVKVSLCVSLWMLCLSNMPYSLCIIWHMEIGTHTDWLTHHSSEQPQCGQCMHHHYFPLHVMYVKVYPDHVEMMWVSCIIMLSLIVEINETMAVNLSTIETPWTWFVWDPWVQVSLSHCQNHRCYEGPQRDHIWIKLRK